MLFLLILLICFSLTGIIAVQIFWIRNAVRIKTEQFDRSVNDALNHTVNRLETRDNLFMISQNLNGNFDDSLMDNFEEDPLFNFRFQMDSLLAESDLDIPPPPPPPVRRKFGHRMEVRFNYNEGELGGPPRQHIHLISQDTNFSRVMVSPDGDSVSLSVHTNINKKIVKKAEGLQDVMDKMTLQLETDRIPIEKRIDGNSINRILARSLTDKGIEIPFEFAVLSGSPEDKPIPIQSQGFKMNNLSTPHRIYLFPNDIFGKPDQLLVYFPSQRAHLLKSMIILLVSSLLFTSIIVFTSIISIITMIRQKKISNIKTDFINNMTHEFKTPIATISIAVDSINNQKIIESPEKIRTFTQIIREENSRMNSRVEQVLQMSLLDSSEFRLITHPADLHKIISKVAEQIRLQVESRNGTLRLNLMAEHSMVSVDEPHFSNIIMTLLDNAIKYSPESPDIEMITSNNGPLVTISIRDKGIGMSADTQKKIFEKFFRVTSGNIHNVKGFGLGLSYAKAIVLAHKGTISVVSEPGKGSMFDVSLPFIPQEMD